MNEASKRKKKGEAPEGGKKQLGMRRNPWRVYFKDCQERDLRAGIGACSQPVARESRIFSHQRVEPQVH